MRFRRYKQPFENTSIAPRLARSSSVENAVLPSFSQALDHAEFTAASVALRHRIAQNSNNIGYNLWHVAYIYNI